VKHVRITVQAGEGVHPVFDMLTGADHVEQVLGLHWNFSGDRLGILHYVKGDREAYLAALKAIPEVLDHDVAVAGEDAFYVYHRCVLTGGAKALFETFSRGSLLLVPPIEFRDGGRSTFSLYGPQAEVQAAIEGVPDPVDVSVEAVGGMEDTPEVTDATLSDRQREAAEAAIELGYYEVPREASHEDVAAAIGCAPSTAAEHLRKAESKLLGSVLG
jgi:hypothetical protein